MVGVVWEKESVEVVAAEGFVCEASDRNIVGDVLVDDRVKVFGVVDVVGERGDPESGGEAVAGVDAESVKAFGVG